MKYIKYIFVALLFIVLLLFSKTFLYGKKKSQPVAENALVVSTFTIKEKTWQSALESIGNVKASKSISLSSEAPGIVTQINFDSGQKVKVGEVLVQLRDDDIKAALLKAQVSLEDDLINYERRKKLLPLHYIAKSEFDHIKALVAKDRADINQQQALLNQRRIIVPFTGFVGIRQVDEGEYVKTGQTIVNLEAMDPVYVDFTIAGKWLSRIKKDEQVKIIADAYPEVKYFGKITATSNAIDLNSRTLTVRALVENPQNKLITGMAVNVFVNEAMQTNIIIPQSALTYTPEGVGVYVIDEHSKANWRVITVGERHGNEVIVLTGLKVGDTVVVAGQQKLHDKVPVTINNQDLLLE